MNYSVHEDLEQPHPERVPRRDHHGHRPEEATGQRVRTCTSCGRRTAVHLDPDGSWAWCSACGHAA
ncbi:MAG: hypothetical protein M3135_01455 [Actinomycetota bacterium]|nr:hypothetical protein [Actinomycetota bacterium]